mgnify:CR=1 FL=1
MRRFIICTLALFGTLIFAFTIEGGNPIDFLLPTPLCIVVCVPLFAVLAVWSLKDWGRAWKAAFVGGGADGATSVRLWDFYEKACYIAGVVSFILGLNVIFSFHGGVERSDIFKPLAVDCVAPILSILFAMVARILKARVEKNERA